MKIPTRVSATAETMGRRKKGRDIDGIVLLDKPAGCSSNAALQRLRRAFDARKAGHTGSLDPLASGLLPVCLGEATKVSSYLLQADKQYRVDAIVGSETTTGDREGEVSRQSGTELPDADTIRAMLADFTGPQRQIPPMYSALKQDGKRLYELARAGQVVAREPRDIVVKELRLVAVGDGCFTLDAVVSSGTYIRTLVEDIARALGLCAHVGALRRERVGVLGVERAMTPLADIEHRAQSDESLNALLLPVSVAIGDWPQVVLDADDAKAIGHGRAVACARTPAARDHLVCVADEYGGLLGLGEIQPDGRLAPKRLFARMQH